MRLKLSMSLLGLVLATTGVARAETVLESTALEAAAPGSLSLCRFVNLSTKPVSIVLEQLDAGGVVQDPEPRTVAAGATADIFPGATGTFRCRFRGTFNKGKASALVAIVVGGNMTVAVPVR